MGPINAHIFRTTTKYQSANPHVEVDYPVTGVVIVPASVIDRNGYISRRIPVIAAANVATLVRVDPEYVAKTVELLMIERRVRRAMGFAGTHPSPYPEHSSTIEYCGACKTAALRIMDEEAWKALGVEIERMCDSVTSCPAGFAASLEERLNLLIHWW